MNIIRPFLTAAILVLSAAASFTAQAGDCDQYQRVTLVTNQSDTLRYRLLRPEHVVPDQSYPLVLLMHGAGERGRDNEQQLVHGASMWLNPVVRDNYPAYVLVPQCPDEGYWAYESRPESFIPSEMPIIDEPTDLIKQVVDLVGLVSSEEQIDPCRIYVIGLSMGGMAVYDLAVRYPHIFAAAVPICGTVNPLRLPAAADVKFRIYHGDADAVVPVEGSREAYRALKNAGADVTYIEFPGVTHGSWNPAFADHDFLPWLFRQSK